MTRKDFKAIAEIVRSEAEDITWSPDPVKILVCHTIAEKLADYLKTTNPRFDREKFLSACGFSS